MGMYIPKQDLKELYSRKLQEKGIEYPTFKEVEKKIFIEKSTHSYKLSKEHNETKVYKNTMENKAKQNKEVLSENEKEQQDKVINRQNKQTLKGFERNYKANEDLRTAYDSWNGFTPDEKHYKKQKNKNRRAKQKQNKVNGNNQRLIEVVEKRVLNGYVLIDNKSIECSVEKKGDR